jgi:serpin B
VKISIANSIWYRLGYDVRVDFIERNKDFYNAEVRELDFADPGAPDTINRWIDSATAGKVKKMIDKISPYTMMYLINAVYFKGDWTHQFSEDETRDEEFTLENGSKKMVPMMQLEEQFRHARGNNLGMLRLPYSREQLAMYILLPDEGEDLDKIIGQLDEDSWKDMQSELKEQQVALRMPRYKVEYEKVLNDVLSSMGMGRAFRGGFSGINERLFISEVKHKAVIEVNERGSEAAAVTVVELTESLPPKPVEFIVNRPFLFTIADDRTGSILFMGKVAEP